MKKFTMTVEVDENGGFGLTFEGVEAFDPIKVVGYLELAKMEALQKGTVVDERWEER